MRVFPGCDHVKAIWPYKAHCVIRGVSSRTWRVELAAPCVQIIEDAAVHEQYSRVITPEPAMNEETEDVCALLQQCLDLRQAGLKPSLAYHTQAFRGTLRMVSACVLCGSVRKNPGLHLKGQQHDATSLQLCWGFPVMGAYK